MSEETVTIDTTWGPVTVTRSERKRWDTEGWPSDSQLRRLAHAQQEGK
jgi:hypothetical protein